MATHMYILYEVRTCGDVTDSEILGCYSDFISAKNASKKHLINYLGEQDSEGESFYGPLLIDGPLLIVNDDEKQIRLLKKNLQEGHVIEINSNNTEDISDFITTGFKYRENSCLKIRYSDNEYHVNEFYLRIEKVEVSTSPVTEYSDYAVKEV